MRVQLDEKADAIYIRLDEAPIVESEEVRPGIVLDFAKDDKVVGIEVLRVRERFPDANFKEFLVEVA